ncbi:hypothetical protein BC829DRAFT_440021 [Chytridium lagenaria]|nr:hypothetical protein BC829DRAFT_440021 [Chytridium lagenaria]
MSLKQTDFRNVVIAKAASRIWVDDAYDNNGNNDNDMDEDTCAICKQHGELLCCDRKEIEGNPSWRSKPVVRANPAYVALRPRYLMPLLMAVTTFKLVISPNFIPSVIFPKNFAYIKSSTTLSTWRTFRGEPSVGLIATKDNDVEPIVNLVIGGSPCIDLSLLEQGAGVVDGEQSSFFF